MKPITVNAKARFTNEVLKGISGNVIGFDSLKDIVKVRIDEFTIVITSSENISQLK